MIRKSTLLLLIFVSGQLFAQSGKIDISNYFSNLSSFQAQFIQIVKQDGNIIQQSFGDVTLAKPLKFNWNYEKPDKIQIISDGKNLFNYDVDLEQVTVKPADEISSSSLGLLLNDKSKLTSIFIVTDIDNTTISDYLANYSNFKKNGDYFFQLIPKGNKQELGGGDIELIIVGFNEEGLLSTFFAKDKFGETTFYFNKIKQNKKLLKNIFNFTAPKGVDVLGDIIQ